MLRLIAVLLLIPLLDAILLAVLATTPWFSVALVVLVVVLTALVGMLLVRAEGRHTLRKIQAKLAQGEPPTDELVDGGLLLVAGAFFLTPGLVTDLLGFLLAVPVTRYPIRLAAMRWVITPYLDAKSGGFATGNVYIGGFPGGQGQGGAGGPGAGPGGPGQGPGGPGQGGAGSSRGSGPGAGDAGSTGNESGTDGGFDRDDATDIDFEETDE